MTCNNEEFLSHGGSAESAKIPPGWENIYKLLRPYAEKLQHMRRPPEASCLGFQTLKQEFVSSIQDCAENDESIRTIGELYSICWRGALQTATLYRQNLWYSGQEDTEQFFMEMDQKIENYWLEVAREQINLLKSSIPITTRDAKSEFGSSFILDRFSQEFFIKWISADLPEPARYERFCEMFNDQSTEMLNAVYEQTGPWPNSAEIQEMANASGRTIEQIGLWFIAKRKLSGLDDNASK